MLAADQTIILTLEILAALLFVALSAFFSGSETGVYRLSRLRLRLGIEQRRRFFHLLGSVLRDSHALILSILIGNNIANYLATGIVTLLLLHLGLSGRAAELYTTALVAPVLFVFAELLPKYFYYYRADTLMPRLAPLLYIFHKTFILTGLVRLLKLISKTFARATGSVVAAEAALTTKPRHPVRQIITETHEEGFISPLQSDLMHRLVNIQYVRLAQVAVPISSVDMTDLTTDRDRLLEKLRHSPYSRLLVYRDSPAAVIGYIHIFSTLCADRPFTDLAEFVKPIPALAASTGVIDALNWMRNNAAEIALVVTGSPPPGRPASPENPPYPRRRIVGIVTIKDLVEELTGELAEW